MSAGVVVALISAGVAGMQRGGVGVRRQPTKRPAKPALRAGLCAILEVSSCWQGTGHLHHLR